MKNLRSKLPIILILWGFCISGLVGSSLNMDLSTPNLMDNSNLLEKDIPKTAITESPIHINNNWSYYEGNYTWFSGTGSEVDPYTIKDLLIDGQGGGYGIKIENTNYHIRIENCTITNTIFGFYFGAIILDQIFNAVIENNTLFENHYGIRLLNSENINITNNYCYNNSVGISLYSTDSSLISYNNCTDQSQEGIRLEIDSDQNEIMNNYCQNNSNGISISFSDNCEIQNNQIGKSNSYSIYVSESTNNTIQENIIYEGHSQNIDFSYASGNFILNNTISNSSNAGFYGYQSHNNLIYGNEIQNLSYYPVYLYFSNNCVIEANDIKNNYMGGIYADNSNETLVKGNLMQNNSDTYAFSFMNSLNLNITNNTLDNNTNSIYISNTNNSIIQNNTINNGLYGINTQYSYYNSIINNFIQNTTSGIYFNHAENHNVTSNSIANCSENGLVFMYGTNNITVVSNKIFDSESGIHIQELNNSQFYENQVYNTNNNGLYAENSLDNTIIMNNNFSENYYGMYIRYSENLTVNSNICNKNYYGIYLYEISNSEFKYNNLEKSIASPLYKYFEENNTYESNYLYEAYANFTTNASTLVTGQTIRINAGLSNGDPTLYYFFNFGDGITTNTENHEYDYSYSTAGNYNISLTVQDTNGMSEVCWKIIQVNEDIVPTGMIQTNTTECETGDWVEFSVSIAAANFPVSYEWDFKDGSLNSIEENPIHQFNNAGEFYVSCNLTDMDGDSVLLSILINVTINNLPIANFSVNATNIFLFEWIQFTDNSIPGDGDLIYEWNFGQFYINSTEINPLQQFIYLNDNLIVTLKVTDQDGDVSYKTETITVENDLLPNATFIVQSTSLLINRLIIFEAINDSGNPNLNYQWDFGDGGANATLSNPNHVYFNSGNYTVTLMITDRNGDVDIYSMEISVEDPADDPTESENNVEDIINSNWFRILMIIIGSVILGMGLLKLISAAKNNNKLPGEKKNSSGGGPSFSNPSNDGNVEWKF